MDRGKPTTSRSTLRRRSLVRLSSSPPIVNLILTSIDAITRFVNETLRVYGVLEIHLSGKYTGEPREYLAGKGKGKYSVADIGTWPWVKGWEKSGFEKKDLDEFPHLLKWIDRIWQREAVKAGTGDKYNPPKEEEKK